MHIALTTASGAPLYEQIVEQLRGRIVSGELPAGTPLPSLRKLAADLRVSLITTTRAYNDLAAEGLIVNAPGRGSFVADVDPEAARAESLQRVRAELRRIAERARETGLLSLDDLLDALREEWER